MSLLDPSRAWIPIGFQWPQVNQKQAFQSYRATYDCWLPTGAQKPSIVH